MKKTLLSLFVVAALGTVNAQNQYSFGFDTALTTAGYQTTNQSTAATTALWNKASFTLPLAGPIFGSGNINTIPVGQAGGNNSFAIVNFNSTTGANDISNWLISPDITVENGDVVSFYARKGTDGTQDYADRLELRMSTASPTVLPTGGPTGLGSFTVLGTSVNPTLVGGFVFPKVWTQYTYTVSGLTGPTVVKFAFRYFVTNGGPQGANSDIIGIDTFSVDRATASTSDFFAKNFSVFPNPSTGIVNLASKNNTAINEVQVTDLNGRVVKNVNTNGVSEAQINISELTSGVYFLNIKTDAGSGTTKIVKN